MTPPAASAAVDELLSSPPPSSARSIIGVGIKVEVWFDEDDLRDAWFPATVIEDLGNNKFLIEYQCSSTEIRKVIVDECHIRPSTPPVRDTNFVLLQKVDAFYDFGWWSGVITKKLADSRYVVYFKHTNKEREFSHVELRLHVESNSVKQTCIVTSMTKRTKVISGGSNDKHLKSCSKLKSGIAFDDQTLSDVVEKSKEPSNSTEFLTRGKRMLVKREKNIEFSSPVPVMITSARKKRRSPDDSRAVKALPKGGKGDLMKIKTPKSVEKVHPPPITCVMGLQCKVMTTMSQTKNVNVKSPTINPLKIVEPLTTPDPDEGKEADTHTDLKRKRGRPFKSKPKKPKTSLAVVTVTHENGDALKKTPQVEKVASTTMVKYKSLKGKRGKRRKIKSINIVSPPEGAHSLSLEDSSSKQKPKAKELGLGLGMEKQLTIRDEDEDQPLSMWFEGKKRLNGEKLLFEKRSTTLWATLEAMEVFQIIPQKPHFRPLEKEKECTREGLAISKMVSYMRLVESVSQQLTLQDRRSAFDESLEVLADLESHGFDVKVVKERLSGLLRIKEKQELLEKEWKKVKERIEMERVEGVRIDKEIEFVDQQVVALLEKRAQVLKKKEKMDVEVGALEAQMEQIHEGIDEGRRNFDGLVASSLCG